MGREVRKKSGWQLFEDLGQLTSNRVDGQDSSYWPILHASVKEKKEKEKK